MHNKILIWMLIIYISLIIAVISNSNGFLGILIFFVTIILLSIFTFFIFIQYDFGLFIDRQSRIYFKKVDRLRELKITDSRIDDLEVKRKKRIKRLMRGSSVIILLNKIYDKITNPFILILLSLYLFLLLYKLVPQSEELYNLIYSSPPFSIIKEYVLDRNSFVLSIINGVNGASVVLISVFLTIFIFTYRERRLVSVSINSLSRNHWFFLMLAIFIFNMVYGWVMYTSLVSPNPSYNFVEGTSFIEIPIYGVRLFIFVLLSLISIFAAVLVIKDLIRSIDLRSVLVRFEKEIRSHFYLNALSNKSSDYIQLRLYIESHYHLLQQSLEKHSGELFSTHFASWKKLLEEFKIESTELDNESYLQTNVFDMLQRKDTNETPFFNDLYRTLLNSHMELIINVMGTNKIKHIEDTIKLYFFLAPENKELNSIYLTSLHELVINIVENYPNRLALVLSELEGFAEKERIYNSNASLKIYKSLILSSCENNDVKNLSMSAYSMLKQVRPGNESLKSTRFKIPRRAFIPNYQIREQTEKAIIYILLQGAIKSIELSTYSCTGFLMKMIVTVFKEQSLVTQVFDEIVNNKGLRGERNPYIERKEHLTSTLRVHPNYNSDTFSYCCEKLSILLYTQYRYIGGQNLPLGSSPRETSIELLNGLKGASEQYLDYLFLKIKVVGNKYGLSFLDETRIEFFENIQEEIRVNVSR